MMAPVGNRPLKALARIVVLWVSSMVLPTFNIQADSKVTVKITVTAPPACTINNNKTIEVNFGEVVTTHVDGGPEYRRPVEYGLVCIDPPSNLMKMMIEGSPTNFNDSALQTNFGDLGIELQANNEKQPINQWLKFDYSNQPKLFAVPVKRSGAKLPTGGFSTGATLKVDYQ